MKKLMLTCFIIVIMISCKKSFELKDSSISIIDEAISNAGGDLFNSSIITFKFRDKLYKAIRNGGNYSLEREFENSDNAIRDVVSNFGFKRFINDELVTIPDSMATKYTNSINSVHYFSVLPYGLNDTAVNKEYLDNVKIRNLDYHKIKVTFNEEGGGTDFDDVFIYWINIDNYEVDYLAYQFHVDGGGFRFREAINKREVNSLAFSDYNNYKPISDNITLEELDDLFDKNELKLLSKIELENVIVNKLVNGK